MAKPQDLVDAIKKTGMSPTKAQQEMINKGIFAEKPNRKARMAYASVRRRGGSDVEAFEAAWATLPRG
jgi:hypothetical protein